MGDDIWDNLVLPKEALTSAKVNLVSVVGSDLPDEPEEIMTAETEKAETREAETREVKSEVDAEAEIPNPILPQAELPNLKAKPAIPTRLEPKTPGSMTPSPYISKYPTVWSADWAGKLASLALAMTIVFGIYSYAEYISEFGAKKTLTGTVQVTENLTAAAIKALGF